MTGRARGLVLRWRPEAWYLLAAALAGGSALASVLDQPAPIAMVVLGGAALCLVVGLALHSAPNNQVGEERPQRSAEALVTAAGGDSERGRSVL